MGTVNLEEQLKRIADALEGINANLDSISASLADASMSLDGVDKTLDGCIYAGRMGNFLRVTGSIETT